MNEDKITVKFVISCVIISLFTMFCYELAYNMSLHDDYMEMYNKVLELENKVEVIENKIN